MSAYFQLMSPRRVSSANYITFINPTSHPDRVMDEHDFLYMLDGSWRIMEENSCYETIMGRGCAPLIINTCIFM